MDAVLQSVIPFVIILIVLVVVHELGHFVTAKLAGVRVLEFGLGYPPRIWGRRIGETEYTINALPLGGFVKLVGEEDPSDPRSLAAQPRPIRLAILLAGVVMNLLLPVVLFAIAFMIPQDVSIGQAQVVAVDPGSPAAAAGIQSGDVIQRVDGREIRNTADLSRAIRLNLGQSTMFVVSRNGTVETLTATPRWAPPEGQGQVGIRIAPRYAFTEREWFPIWEALPEGVDATVETLQLARNEVISWFKGGSQPALSGPVGIAQATGEVVEQAGWLPLLEFGALLSINLAIINLLPLPMLDGGRIAFVILEILRGGRRISPQREGLVHLVGFAALISFVIFVSYFDILRVISGKSIFQ
ncbi:MAG: RIP metalloprotease [Dehalococcoidia bacterium]|nr:RIP metalloprotease [Dehalococcoidia bacterium]